MSRRLRRKRPPREESIESRSEEWHQIGPGAPMEGSVLSTNRALQGARCVRGYTKQSIEPMGAVTARRQDPLDHPWNR